MVSNVSFKSKLAKAKLDIVYIELRLKNDFCGPDAQSNAIDEISKKVFLLEAINRQKLTDPSSCSISDLTEILGNPSLTAE